LAFYGSETANRLGLIHSRLSVLVLIRGGNAAFHKFAQRIYLCIYGRYLPPFMSPAPTFFTLNQFNAVFLNFIFEYAVQALSRSDRYFSIDMPTTFILFLIMKTGTSLYFGMTTGRIAPG
jgi:hypothetical protein